MALASQSGSPVSRRNMYRRRRRRPGRFIAFLVIVTILGGTWYMWSGPEDTMATTSDPESTTDLTLDLEPTGNTDPNDGRGSTFESGRIGGSANTGSSTANTELADGSFITSEPEGNTPTEASTTAPTPGSGTTTSAGEPDPMAPVETTNAASEQLLGALTMVETDPMEARRQLSDLVMEGMLGSNDRAAARAALTRLGADLFYTPNMMPGDPFVRRYLIQGGDSLDRIARQSDVHVEWGMIQDINMIRDPARIRLGQALKLPVGVFHAHVSKSDFTLDLYLSNGEDEVIIASYPVGLGALNGTPTGRFKVRSNSKLKNPQWKNPRTGEFFLPDDPSNPIGERWIGLQGIDPSNEGLLGYGIHGTVEPDSIGANQSMGCIRLLGPDVERVYDALTTEGSMITISP